MSKITNKQIQEKITRLQEDGYDIAINFQGSPARGRITNKSGDKDLSDRMVSTDLAVWLDGWRVGRGTPCGNSIKKEVLELQ